MDKTRLQRRQLEKIFSEIRRMDIPLATPQKGWMNAIRTALGMPLSTIAKRLGQTPQGVKELELREAEGTVTLGALRRAADAIDCRLVYVLLPNTPLETMIEREAERIATDMMHSVSMTMALEDQRPTAEAEEDAHQDVIEKLKSNPRMIWKERR